MDINHYVLIKIQDENVGLFQKKSDMPSVPNIGSLVTFGNGFWTITCVVEGATFREDEGTFSIYYTIDVEERRSRLKEYISVDHYPQILVNRCGFNTCWLEGDYNNIAEKLKSTP